MIKLVLVRHGESIWNKENKFTGWTDVPLSDKGIEEAKNAGILLKENGYTFDIAYTSLLKRVLVNVAAQRAKDAEQIVADRFFMKRRTRNPGKPRKIFQHFVYDFLIILIDHRISSI